MAQADLGRDRDVIEKCRIRPFRPSDLPRLHEIRKAAFMPVFQSFRSIVGKKVASIAIAAAECEQADSLDQICKHGASHEVIVVDCGSEVIAFCAISLDRKTKIGEIDLNAVHPDYQGNGVGTWMYASMLDRMKQAGMCVATVGTGGDQSHVPARRAYENVGFSAAIPSLYYYRSL